MEVHQGFQEKKEIPSCRWHLPDPSALKTCSTGKPKDRPKKHTDGISQIPEETQLLQPTTPSFHSKIDRGHHLDSNKKGGAYDNELKDGEDLYPDSDEFSFKLAP